MLNKNHEAAITLILVSFGLFICQGRNTNCMCKRGCMENCAFMTLSCPAGHVIYNPDVIGDEDSTCETFNGGSCKGMSPDLKINVAKCYWKNSCNIFFPKMPMALDFSNNNWGCFNQQINSFWIRGWSCVNETEIHDMCVGMSDLNPGHGTKGIIRSHPRFPWINQSQHSTCFKNLGPYLSDKDLYNRVALSVHTLDIDTSSVTVSLLSRGHRENEDLKIQSANKMKYYEADEKTGIRIRVQNMVNETRIGNGFVLCYKFLKSGEVIDENLCDEILGMENSPVCNVCRYNTGKWTKCIAMQTRLIANLTEGGNPSCPKTKVMEAKTCDCKYKEVTTKCNLQSNSYFVTKTLTAPSDQDICERKHISEMPCKCVYSSKSRCLRRKRSRVKKLVSGDKKLCPTFLEVGKCKRKNKRRRKKCKYRMTWSSCVSGRKIGIGQLITRNNNSNCSKKVTKEKPCKAQRGNRRRG